MTTKKGSGSGLGPPPPPNRSVVPAPPAPVRARPQVRPVGGGKPPALRPLRAPLPLPSRPAPARPAPSRPVPALTREDDEATFHSSEPVPSPEPSERFPEVPRVYEEDAGAEDATNVMARPSPYLREPTEQPVPPPKRARPAAGRPAPEPKASFNETAIMAAPPVRTPSVQARAGAPRVAKPRFPDAPNRRDPGQPSTSSSSVPSIGALMPSRSSRRDEGAAMAKTSRPPSDADSPPTEIAPAPAYPQHFSPPTKPPTQPPSEPAFQNETMAMPRGAWTPAAPSASYTPAPAGVSYTPGPPGASQPPSPLAPTVPPAASGSVRSLAPAPVLSAHSGLVSASVAIAPPVSSGYRALGLVLYAAPLALATAVLAALALS